MRQKKTANRGRGLLLLVASAVGYLLGGWHAAAVRNSSLSPAQTVALRFPEDWDGAATFDGARGLPRSATSVTGTMVLGDPQLPLLSPEPMVPRSGPQAASDTAGPTATPEGAALPELPATQPSRPAAPVTRRAIQAATHPLRPVDRPGFVLNDAQIASIKQRLRLTPDQETMWPAVEAALRNVAYARARDARRRGAPASSVQLALADPDSAEVQGLKSAAIPLLMSFSAEQKSEVRGLAHVMGLDRLAAEL